jgi:hypothetical protein
MSSATADACRCFRGSLHDKVKDLPCLQGHKFECSCHFSSRVPIECGDCGICAAISRAKEETLERAIEVVKEEGELPNLCGVVMAGLVPGCTHVPCNRRAGINDAISALKKLKGGKE